MSLITDISIIFRSKQRFSFTPGKFAILPFYLGYLCFLSRKFTLNNIKQKRRDYAIVEFSVKVLSLGDRVAQVSWNMADFS